MTKKSNAVELVSVFDKIKPCGLNSHGSCSNLHTPLRGEQQATVLFMIGKDVRKL